MERPHAVRLLPGHCSLPYHQSKCPDMLPHFGNIQQQGLETGLVLRGCLSSTCQLSHQVWHWHFPWVSISKYFFILTLPPLSSRLLPPWLPCAIPPHTLTASPKQAFTPSPSLSYPCPSWTPPQPSHSGADKEEPHYFFSWHEKLGQGWKKPKRNTKKFYKNLKWQQVRTFKLLIVYIKNTAKVKEGPTLVA